MGRAKAAVPEFDDQAPWGTYPRAPAIAVALKLAHTMPRALSSLTKLLRRPVRRRLTFNAKNNGLSDIELCPVALSDHEGQAELQVNPRQRGQNTLDLGEARRAGGERQSLTVPLTTLLALLQGKGIGKVDVLKIDIEGHEPPVLRHFLTHAPESMWPGAVISEFKDQTASDILGLFEQRGYRRRETTKLNFILERG